MHSPYLSITVTLPTHCRSQNLLFPCYNKLWLKTEELLQGKASLGYIIANSVLNLELFHCQYAILHRRKFSCYTEIWNSTYLDTWMAIICSRNLFQNYLRSTSDASRFKRYCYKIQFLLSPTLTLKYCSIWLKKKIFRKSWKNVLKFNTPPAMFCNKMRNFINAPPFPRFWRFVTNFI